MKTELLRVTLSPSELEAKGKALCGRLSEIERIKELAKEQAAEARERVKELQTEVSDMALDFQLGSEERAVPVEVHRDQTEMVMRTFRLDTGEEVFELRRPMTASERQGVLFPIRGSATGATGA